MGVDEMYSVFDLDLHGVACHDVAILESGSDPDANSRGNDVKHSNAGIYSSEANRRRGTSSHSSIN